MQTIKRAVPVIVIMLFAAACAAGPTEPGFEVGGIEAEDGLDEGADVTQSEDLDAARARLAFARRHR